MVRTAAPLFACLSVICLGAAGGCAVSASTSASRGTTPEAGSDGRAAQSGQSGQPGQPGQASSSGRDPAAAGGSEAGPGATPAPAACEPSQSSLATAFFGGRMLLKLPTGIELVEQNPFYAQLAAPAQATSCGAPVRYAAAGFFEYPGTASPAQVRELLLTLRGIPADTVTWADASSQGRNYAGAYSASEDPKTGAAPVRGYLVLREAPSDKYLYFALFETDEASWPGLQGLFAAVGQSLMIKPHSTQGPPSAIQAAPAK